jgi:hypothetical protein
MTRVVVLGAKPNAVIPPGDAIFCANAAALTDPAAVRAFPYRTVVASGPVVAKGLKPHGEGLALDELRAQCVCAFDGEEAIIFIDRFSRWFSILQGELVNAGPKGRAVHFLSTAERRSLVCEFIDFYPLVDRRYLRQPVLSILSDSVRLAGRRLQWLLGNQTHDVPPKFRPSTGILALLLAIKRHGGAAQYILSGIGLGNRDVYDFGGRIFDVRRAGRAELAKHVLADVIVLEQLAGRFNIGTTEHELAPLVPLVPA